MKIKTEQDLSCKDMEITIKYAQEDRQVTRILDFLQSLDMQIRCSIDDAEQMIDIADIYYIESVDKKLSSIWRRKCAKLTFGFTS